MVYYCKNFTGVYPTSTCAIIVANNRQQAEDLLEDELAKAGLTQRSDWKPVLVEVDQTSPHSIMVNDGDY